MESVLQAFALFQMSDVTFFGHKKTGHQGRFFLFCIPRQKQRETKFEWSG